MLETLSISKQNPQFPAYLDFQTLRQIGIARLEKLAGKLWTDYNLHDPGVTILEALCYAITDLGYRNNLSIEDLLALPPLASENNFFTPDQILTCNPVTIVDIRKRLIDIAGVHNAWIEKVTTYEPPIWIDAAHNHLKLTSSQDETLPRLHPRGLYKVILDLDPDYYKNACGQLYQSWSDVLDEVKQVLCRYRNLCEDIHDIVILDQEEIRLCADIELAPDTDAEDALVGIYAQVQDFLVPQIQFYTLQQLLDQDQSITDIFAGRPAHDDLGEHYNSHGFIKTEELEQLTLPKIIHTSDIYQDILNVSGVAAIKRLLIASSINGLPQTQESLWYLQLTEQYRPVLSIKGSTIRLFKNGLPIPVNLDEVERRYYEQRSTSIKTKRDPYELELTVPPGKYAAELENHYSVHRDFPLTYGISEDGLPEPVSAQREAQAKQLKAYLVFFDQLLANYLSQLAHVRDLFSWEVDSAIEDSQNAHAKRPLAQQKTYFSQTIQFPGWQEILQENYLDSVSEDRETYRDRRSRFLDHLLARFAESFSDYVLLNTKMTESHQDKIEHESHLIQEKARFLQDYPVLSRDRFRAFNYCNCQSVWNTENVSGFKKRVSRLLGIENVQQRPLNHYKVESDPGGFTLSIRCGTSLELTSKQVYTTQAEAQTAGERLLSFALCSNYYQRLSYQFYYHYGLEIEVIKDGEPIQARYDRYFLSQHDRVIALQRLRNLPDLAIVITTSQDRNGLSTFQILIGEDIRFTGVQRYFSEEAAREKATAIVAQIRNPQSYSEILFLTTGSAERETSNPSREARFTHYGYALVNHEGTVLAESNQRFAEALERDVALKCWLSSIRASTCAEGLKQDTQTFGEARNLAASAIAPLQFVFAVQPHQGNYHFVLQDAQGNTMLRSLEAYAADQVWEQAYQFAEHLFYLSRYVATDQADLTITNQKGEPIAISETEYDRLTLFKHLNSIEPFLTIQTVQVEIDHEQVTRYRGQFSDRSGEVLLEATQLFEEVETARDRFYEDVLGKLFEPGLRYSSKDKNGFGFGVLSRAGDCHRRVAIHPKFYLSESERDAAVNQLFLLVRAAQLVIVTEPQAQAFVGRIYACNGLRLLQTVQRFTSEVEGWKQGNFLLELAADEAQLPTNGQNFRLINSQDSICGWELTNAAKDQILATQFYQNQHDRNTAIQTLQQHVNDEGFHVLEHILLRPRQSLNSSEALLPIYVTPDDTWDDSLFTIANRDPYSFWITIVLPYWSERFRNINFRRFVERTLRLEAPAHVALKIAWVDAYQMEQFETAYGQWLEQLTQLACENTACDLAGALNQLIQILTRLRSVYPQGVLADAEGNSSEPNPIILNQTALGKATP